MSKIRSIVKFILNLGEFVVILMTIGILIYLYILRPFQIDGYSMYPTFDNEQYLLTNLRAYNTKQPEYGDIVVFRSPTDARRDYIKRVIAKPGDTVEINDGGIYVNGEQLDESFYLKSTVTTDPGRFMDEGEDITVPYDEYFLVGDNRPGSSDSRDYGTVPIKNIYGKVIVRVWPVTQFNIIKHSSDQN